MGLDMGLHRRVRLSDKVSVEPKVSRVRAVLGDRGYINDNEVCYWRKFNALHKYFDDNFNEHNDNDNCVDMYLTLDDIKKLLALMKKLKKGIKVGDGLEVAFSRTYNLDTDGYLKGCKAGDDITDRLNKEDGIVKAVVERVSEDGWVYVNFLEKGSAITNPEFCEELLPTTEGFFFGTTEYGSYYIECIDDTIKQLTRVIDEHKELIECGFDEWDIEYYYRAWY